MKQIKQNKPPGQGETRDTLTSAEAAALLGVSVQAVVKRLHKGTLPGFRLFGDSGQWRIPRHYVEHLLRRQQAVLQENPSSPAA